MTDPVGVLNAAHTLLVEQPHLATFTVRDAFTQHSADHRADLCPTPDHCPTVGYARALLAGARAHHTAA